LANTTSDLSTKKHDLEDKTALSANFIVKSPGVTVKTFAFSAINFKIAMIHDAVPAPVKAYILQMLRYFYEQGSKLVELITSPDVDIDKFSSTFVNSIEQLRKHIPRCDKAFNKLRDSVGLLKSNFGGYYKEFAASQSNSPTLILENYIRDVTKTSKADPTLITQFRRIISFCRQNMDDNKHRMGNVDPRINNIMNMMNDNLSTLEKSKP
jgi:hypothetical protein